MPDWRDTLDARKAGGVPGFQAAGTPFAGAPTRSELAYAELTANFATASLTDVDVGLLVSVDKQPGDQPVLVRLAGLFQHSAASGLGVFTIVDETNAAILIGSSTPPVAGTSVPIYFEKRLVIPAGTAKTFKARMRVGAGTGTLYATAPDDIHLQVLAV